MEAHGPGPWRTNQILSGAVHLLNATPEALSNKSPERFLRCTNHRKYFLAFLVEGGWHGKFIDNRKHLSSVIQTLTV